MESMLEAGREEKRLAEQAGSFYEGVPAITMIVDGARVSGVIPIILTNEVAQILKSAMSTNTKKVFYFCGESGCCHIQISFQSA